MCGPDHVTLKTCSQFPNNCSYAIQNVWWGGSLFLYRKRRFNLKSLGQCFHWGLFLFSEQLRSSVFPSKELIVEDVQRGNVFTAKDNVES